MTAIAPANARTYGYPRRQSPRGKSKPHVNDGPDSALRPRDAHDRLGRSQCGLPPKRGRFVRAPRLLPSFTRTVDAVIALHRDVTGLHCHSPAAGWYAFRTHRRYPRSTCRQSCRRTASREAEWSICYFAASPKLIGGTALISFRSDVGRYQPSGGLTRPTSQEAQRSPRLKVLVELV